MDRTATLLGITSLLVLFGHAPRAVAADYYACDCASGATASCVAGDDAASGATPGTAWRSYEQARRGFASLAAGDSLHLCRGGSFEVTGSTRWNNARCRAALPCTVTDYTPEGGSSGDPPPTVRQHGVGHGFAFEDGGSADHEEGYVFSNLAIVGSLGGAGSGAGIFVYNDVDDVLLDNLYVEGFDFAVYVAGSNPCGADPACDGMNERVTLNGSTIVNNARGGWLGASNGGAILDNYFEGNGTRRMFDHSIYLAADTHQVSAMRVSGNRLYHTALSQAGSCSAVALVAHGTFDDLVIENNEIIEDVGFADEGCWGVAVDAAYSAYEAFTNVVIRNNRVSNVGNVGIGVSACGNCTIENNIIAQEQAFASTGVAVPDRPESTSDLVTTAVTVRNNLVYIANAAAHNTGIRITGTGTGHTVVQNAVHYAGDGSGWVCVDTTLAPSAFSVLAENLCYAPREALAK